MPVELKTPFGKCLRARVVAAAGAGGENENAKLGHAAALLGVVIARLDFALKRQRAKSRDEWRDDRLEETSGANRAAAPSQQSATKGVRGMRRIGAGLHH